MSKSVIPTKDNIWNILKALSAENRKFSAESRQRSAESRQEIKALSAETSQRIREHSEENLKRFAETNQQIKALSAENRKFSAESRQRSAEWDQQMKKRSVEWNQRMKEMSVKSEKIDKRLDKAIGLFETQWGKLMESLVEGDLIKILQAQGIEVINTHPNVKHRSAKDQYEYDILAVNGKEVVGVEVKTTLKVKHVKAFLEELKKFTHRFPHYKDSTIYGAVAFLRADEASTIYAEKQGLFVIRATGSSASLINEKGFKPKVFS